MGIANPPLQNLESKIHNWIFLCVLCVSAVQFYFFFPRGRAMLPERTSSLMP